MRINISILFILLFTFVGYAQDEKIKVLNIGVFHMGYTPDANTVEYDEASKKSKKEIKEVCEAIAKFKPTIILVEQQSKYQKDLDDAYNLYLQDVNADTGYYKNNEIQLLGFEIGRLTSVKKIYGIDHQLSLDYPKIMDLGEKNKNYRFLKTKEQVEKKIKTLMNVPKKGLKEVLLIYNKDETYDFLINANADLLIYANSKNGFEGADEASKFYKRNIRMFANINKIQMKKNDRVLIISGATHAAYFSKFMSRSMIYELEPITNYLN